MDFNVFVDYLRKEIQKNSCPERCDSATFLIWFLQKYYDLPKDESISLVCDSENDKGIDGIYVDDIEQEIHVFQSKLKGNDGYSIGDKVLRDFKGVTGWFENSEKIELLINSTINPELKQLLINNKIKDKVEEYEVKYIFLINASNDHNTNEYVKTWNNLTLWSIENLHTHFKNLGTEPLVQDTKVLTNLNRKKVIIEELQDTGIISFPLLASDLITFKGIDDLSLFNINVRYGLGRTRVNKAIVKTLKNRDEKDKFLLFHNGISIICESFNYDENSESLTITNYSIANGAQSTLTFKENESLLDDNIKVFIRVISVGKNPDLAELISYYNNNQNAISLMDLRANDLIQMRIEKEFKDLSAKYNLNVSYIRKLGQDVPNGFFELRRDYAAQLILACYLGEPYNTHLKTAMFDEKYTDIFNKNISAFILYVYYTFHCCLHDLSSEFEDYKLYDYGLAQFFILNVMIQFLKENYPNIYTNCLLNEESYFKNRESIKEFIKEILQLIINIFNFVLNELKNTDTEFVYKNYFKSKKELDKTKDSIKANLKMGVITHKLTEEAYIEKYKLNFQNAYIT